MKQIIISILVSVFVMVIIPFIIVESARPEDDASSTKPVKPIQTTEAKQV